VDLPHFVSPCVGELDGGQIGNLMELCDTAAPSIFLRAGCGRPTLQWQRACKALGVDENYRTNAVPG